MAIKLKGTGVALVTPFNENKDIDFEGTNKLIEHVITNKVDYLVVMGTTGESPVLTKEEKIKLFEFVEKSANKRVPLVAGVGGNNTEDIINFLKEFSFNGYDAILSVSPYYNKPSQEGIYQHYMKVADNAPLPVILYNVPGRTGSNITAATILRLGNDNKNIIAVKEASGNMEQCMHIIKNKPEDFMVISGDDALTLPYIAMGMDGVISVVANAFPGDFSEMVRLALSSNFEEARKLHNKLLDIIGLLFAENSPGGIKCALNILQICKNELRLPLVPISDSLQDKLKGKINQLV